jgi:galactokinase
VANVPPEVAAVAKDANDHYTRAQDALKSGDFTAYGQEMKQVQADLQRLNQITGQ